MSDDTEIDYTLINIFLLYIHRRANPKNLIPYYLENYIDFLTLVISEEKSRFDVLKNNKSCNSW